RRTSIDTDDTNATSRTTSYCSRSTSPSSRPVYGSPNTSVADPTLSRVSEVPPTSSLEPAREASKRFASVTSALRASGRGRASPCSSQTYSTEESRPATTSARSWLITTPEGTPSVSEPMRRISSLGWSWRATASSVGGGSTPATTLTTAATVEVWVRRGTSASRSSVTSVLSEGTAVMRCVIVERNRRIWQSLPTASEGGSVGGCGPGRGGGRAG